MGRGIRVNAIAHGQSTPRGSPAWAGRTTKARRTAQGFLASQVPLAEWDARRSVANAYDVPGSDHSSVITGA